MMKSLRSDDALHDARSKDVDDGGSAAMPDCKKTGHAGAKMDSDFLPFAGMTRIRFEG